MSLRRRLEVVAEVDRSWVGPHQVLKNAVHRRLIEESGRRGGINGAREEVEREVARILDREDELLTREDRSRLIADIVNEAMGYGPIDPLVRDPAITEVMVNGPGQVYVGEDGKLDPTGIRFRDDQHGRRIIVKIGSGGGR